MAPSSSTSRRRFLTAATATAVAVPAVTAAGGSRDLDQQTTIRLASDIQGWRGVSPDRIEGEENPTLYLTAGEEYELVWENADGVGHNLVLRDENDESVARTETVGEEGATRSISFTASEDLVSYRCGIHPSSMQGDISFGDPPTGTTTQGTPTTDDVTATEATDDETATEATDDETTADTAATDGTDPQTTASDDGSDGGGQPGFGVLAAAAGLLGALGIRRRQR